MLGLLTATTKCGYCYEDPTECRAVQLSHDTNDPDSWQTPIWCCADCRAYLHGQFRYVRDGQYRIHHPEPRLTIELATNMHILLAQAEEFDGQRFGV